MKKIQDTIAEMLAERARERAAPAPEAAPTPKDEPPPPAAAKRAGASSRGHAVTQLPLWRDDRRGVPNDLVRSALFTVSVKDDRQIFNKVRLATMGQVELIYSGPELRQKELDVFLQLVHYQRSSPMGELVSFRAHGMLQALGWTTGTRGYGELEECIERLKAADVKISARDGAFERGYSGRLIRSFEYKKELSSGRTLEWGVRLEPTILALFSNVSYSAIDWAQRKELGPLAKWLHSFYSTHSEPYALKVDYLHRLCGSRQKSMRRFKQAVRDAVEQLVEVGFFESAVVDEAGLVRVKRAKRRPRLTAETK